MNRAEQAVELKHHRHNCTQAVLGVFADELGLTTEETDRLGAAFGNGMGTMGATCGALVAAGMILGLKTFEGRPVLRDASTLHEGFREMCGATICKDLKGRDTGVVLCECDDCVRNAVRLVEEFFAKA